jgi:hypothetical protein
MPVTEYHVLTHEFDTKMASLYTNHGLRPRRFREVASNFSKSKLGYSSRKKNITKFLFSKCSLESLKHRDSTILCISI